MNRGISKFEIYGKNGAEDAYADLAKGRELMDEP